MIIPAEYAFEGWEKFGECLKSFFWMKFTNRGNVIKAERRKPNLDFVKQKGREQQRSNIHQTGGINSLTRDPSLAVVILKNTNQTSWKVISEQMHRKIGRTVVVVPFADDKVVIWCANEGEVMFLMEKDDLYKGRNFLAKIKRWNMYMHWEYIQTEAKNNWIGIEGLPLNLRNMDTFRSIGEACGGLL